jgi:hypothetical protein
MTRLWAFVSVRFAHWARIFLAVEVAQFILAVLGVVFLAEHAAHACGFVLEWQSPVALRAVREASSLVVRR